MTIYEAFMRTPEKLREFEDTVARLREMERLGLVGKLFIQTRTSSGTESVEMVMVTGGLTAEGAQLLAQHHGDNRSDSSNNSSNEDNSR